MRVFFSRVVDDEICLTMDDGRSALKALELDGKEVNKIAGTVGFFAKITLLTPSILEVQEL